MNINQYVFFLERIHFRENVKLHEANLNSITKIIERVVSGTYNPTIYKHRSTNIVLLAEIKNERIYTKIIEKVLRYKLAKNQLSRQEELFKLSKTFTKEPFIVRYPPEAIVDKINALIDAYEAKYDALGVHPSYCFIYNNEKITFKPLDKRIMLNDFPAHSYEAKKITKYLGTELPNTPLLINKTVPRIAPTEVVVRSSNLKQNLLETREKINAILLEGIKHSEKETRKLNRKLSEDIRNLR